MTKKDVQARNALKLAKCTTQDSLDSPDILVGHLTVRRSNGWSVDGRMFPINRPNVPDQLGWISSANFLNHHRHLHHHTYDDGKDYLEDNFDYFWWFGKFWGSYRYISTINLLVIGIIQCPYLKRFLIFRKRFRICELRVSGFPMEGLQICDSRYTQHFHVGIVICD